MGQRQDKLYQGMKGAGTGQAISRHEGGRDRSSYIKA